MQYVEQYGLDIPERIQSQLLLFLIVPTTVPYVESRPMIDMSHYNQKEGRKSFISCTQIPSTYYYYYEQLLLYCYYHKLVVIASYESNGSKEYTG